MIVSVNPQRSRSADYEIPASFRLREHATSRQAWELGDGEAVRVVVEFHDESGPAMAARKLGAAVAGAPMQRAFDVRRPDAFVRWAMSFAGSVVPVSPAGIVAQFSRAVEDTMRVYDDPAPREVPAVAMPAPSARSGTAQTHPAGRAAHRRR